MCDQVPDCPEGEDEDNCQVDLASCLLFVCTLLVYTLLLKVREQEIIVNYDGQESGDYEEEDNGGAFGSWDFW